jgi:ketosteroid isomerase-like protein
MLPDRRYRRRSSDWKTKRGQHVKILSAAALVAAGLIALAGCQKATDSAAFEKQAKEDVRNFIPAFNTGDIDTIMEMYAPDAEVLAPANPRAVGTEAIRALVTKMSGELQAGGITLELNDDDKGAASGDLGWHSGSYVVKDASGAVVDSGNYLAVMQKQADGKWLMIRDTWNSDRPPPAPPAAEPAEATPTS